MKKGFTCGAFDLCHAGHVLMFKECREQCDYLVVGLHSDPTLDRPEKNKPIQSVEERKTMLEGIKYIDEVLVYDTEAELLRLLTENKLGIKVRFIGADWKKNPRGITGPDLPIEVIYNSRDHGYSTTELRDRIYKAEKAKREN
jgi:glycerol-3-phosphate cytidylyltransferase